MTLSADPSAAPLLDVHDLAVAFGSVEAVRGISFRVGEGEIIGLVGESGSGKSVTCRALLGLLPAGARATGRVGFCGRDLLSLREDAMRAVRGREISMIFQNPSSHLDPLMTVGGHVAESLRHHFGQSRSQARESAVEVLRSVQITDPERRVDAYPHELSGGMKQRGLIGAAMACKPRLLLADEPTTALDVTVQARILDLLRDLNRREGVSIILVSHDLAVVAALCDRVVVMRRGEIVEHGPTRELMRAPRHAYTRLLVESQPSALSRPEAPRARPGDAALFAIDRLSVTYHKPGLLPGARRGVVRALDAVSFTIEEGECFGIVGESGSGKSTIARSILRLVEPSGGAIRFRGDAIAGLRGAALARFRRRVQMVFQNPFDSLNPRLRVFDAIAEPLIRHKIARRGAALERAHALMRQVDLPEDLAGRRPKQLSGGQCQRVGIARALALEPEVLIADEITSALDVTIQAQILKLLQRLRTERGLTVVYISHDLAVVRSFCDRIAVFRAARLVEIGSAEQVLDHPREEYTKALKRAAPRLDAPPGPAGCGR